MSRRRPWPAACRAPPPICRVPPARPAGGTSGASRRTEEINYQSSRVVRHVKLPQGELKRVSVSLLVDQDVRWEGKRSAPATGPDAAFGGEAEDHPRPGGRSDQPQGRARRSTDRGDAAFRSHAAQRASGAGGSSSRRRRRPPAGLPAWLRTSQGNGRRGRRRHPASGAGGGGVPAAPPPAGRHRRGRTALPPGAQSAPALAEGDSVEKKIQAHTGRPGRDCRRAWKPKRWTPSRRPPRAPTRKRC